MKIEEKAKKWAEAQRLQDDTKERWAAHGFEYGMRHGLRVALEELSWATGFSTYWRIEEISNGTRDLPEKKGE